MDCQRAETHLRLLAEEELRRPASAWGERRIRVGRVADLLTAIGALDDEVADQIMADFDLALAARQADARGRRFLPREVAAAVSRRAVPAGHAGELRVARARVGSRAGWSGWGR